MQIQCFKAKTGKAWIHFFVQFCDKIVYIHWVNWILIYQHTSHSSLERYTSLTSPSDNSGLWKSRYSDSRGKDFWPVILHQAIVVLLVFLSFSPEVSVEWYRKGYELFLLLMPSKALNKCQNICIPNKLPILIFPVEHNHLYSRQVLSLHQDQPGLLYM